MKKTSMVSLFVLAGKKGYHIHTQICSLAGGLGQSLDATVNHKFQKGAEVKLLPVTGQHGGAVSLGLRGRRAGGVAGETALRHHPRQEGLVLAHHAGDAHGVDCGGEGLRTV